MFEHMFDVAEDRQVLPDNLEDAPIGVSLAAVVMSADRTKLNGHDALRLLKAEARLASHFEAAKLATMVEVAHSPASEFDSPVERSPEVLEYASDEIAAALRLTRRSADRELDLALSLSERLRKVWARLRDGVLDVARARVFHDQLGHLPQETVDAVIEQLGDEPASLTTGQVRARLEREVLKLDPDGRDLAYQAGLDGRKVIVYSNPDHTATIHASNLPPDRAAAAMTRINDLARELSSGDETRTIDQVRSDIFLDLLEGKPHLAGGAGGVHLNVDLATLTELSDDPGELAGYGPVIADIARKTAVAMEEASWDFTVRDDVGRTIHGGTTRRRPTRSLGRQIAATYEDCVAPGCRMPVHQCDLDHRHPWVQGGRTTVDNVAPLCRHHHMMKHHAPWKLERLPTGDHRWTTRLGHSYVSSRGPPA